MPIAIICGSCEAKLNAPDAAAGKRVKCPKCGVMLEIPVPEPDYEVVEDEPKAKPKPVAKAPPPAPAKPKPKPVVLDEADDEEDERPTPKKKPKPPVRDEEDEDDRPAPKPKKKPAVVDEDDEDERPAPKPKKKPARVADEDDEDEPRPKKGKGGKKPAPKNKLPLILGIGGGALVLIGVAVWLLFFNGDGGNNVVKPGPDGKVAGNTDTPTPFTSEEIHKAFKDDPQGFSAKYKGKLVEVTGQVRDMDKDGRIQLVGNPTVRFDSFQCHTTDPEPWKTVLPGQTVTLVGTYEPKAVGLASLGKAKITRVEGQAPTPLDAGKLGAELLANPAAVEARYKGNLQALANSRSLLFVGKFAKTGTKYDKKDSTWLLEQTDGVKLELSFSGYTPPTPTPAAGQEIKFVSNCAPHGAKKEIEFGDALIVSVK